MVGAETLDHIAIPVRDLERAEKFYIEAVGLKMLTQRKNADGSPRHTYVLAGENIIGLNLPGIQTEPSPSGAPRYAIALSSEDAFHSTVEKIKAAGVRAGQVREHRAGSFFVKSLRFVDAEQNSMEVCLRRDGGKEIYLSHVVFEATDLERAVRFYTRALGLTPAGAEGDETFLMFPNRQLIGLKPVVALSERTKKHGRAVHVALNVSQEDFDEMVAAVSEKGGRSHGDFRATDGLRPPGERSIYLFDPDTNELQITAHGEEDWSLMPDEEKWRRTSENREVHGKGLSRFDLGKSKSSTFNV
jgi:catechol 2,3-dioxygenase-like lactoylglutathione lyase family enzyme